MSQEIKVGSKWIWDELIVTVVYVNAKKVGYEFDDLGLSSNEIECFLEDYTPYIEPKPPLKIEAWSRNTDNKIEYYAKSIQRTGDWTREPLLDYEVSE